MRRFVLVAALAGVAVWLVQGPLRSMLPQSQPDTPLVAAPVLPLEPSPDPVIALDSEPKNPVASLRPAGTTTISPSLADGLEPPAGHADPGDTDPEHWAPVPAEAPQLDLTWLEQEVRSGDTLSGIFKTQGIDASDVSRIAALSDGALKRLKPGHQLDIQVDPDGAVHKVRYDLDGLDYLEVTRYGDDFVAARLTRDFDVLRHTVRGEVRSSLFQAGSDAGLPDALMLKYASVFRWTVDFARDLQPGDQFTFVYEDKLVDGRKVGGATILAAELVNGGNTHRAIRYVVADGREGYYTPDGDSVERAFLRSPVAFNRVTSGFAKRRYHPILKTWRSHKGVDYAAAPGTPVYATGGGKVTHMGRKGGYGKTVVIQHPGGYTTLYAHLSGFHRGVRSGQTVSQGDIVGYVGSTGLATGPHLHYEFRVGGVHRDPLTVELPTAGPIPESERTEFLLLAEEWMAEFSRDPSLYLTQAD